MRIPIDDCWRLQEHEQRADDRWFTHGLDHFHRIGSLGGIRDPGFLTFSAGLAALVFGLIRSNADGWSSATVAGSLTAAVVLLVAFLLIERLGREPMLDLGLLRVSTFGGGLVAAWAISASIFSLLTYLVLYLQNVLGLSALATGVRFLPLSGALFVTAAVAGRLTAQVRRRVMIAPASS